MSYTPFPVHPRASDGDGGVTSHGALTGRSAANAHPVSAITGLQDALDAGARVWLLDNIVTGLTIEDLIAFATWAVVPASAYAWDSEGLKYVDKDNETVTPEGGHQPGDIAIVGRTVNLVTNSFGDGGLQPFADDNTLDIDGPWLRTADANVTVDASAWTGTLSSVNDSATLEEVLDALGALDFASTGDPPDLSGYVQTDDARLTDDRFPTSHAGTHLPGGSDPIFSPRFRPAEPETGFSIDVGETVNLDLEMSPLYALTLVRTAEAALRIRVYTDSERRTADAARPFGTPPTGDHGVLLDVELDNTSKLDLIPAVIGYTAGADFDEHPNGSTVPVAVTNIGEDDVPSTIGVNFVYVDLHDGIDGTPLTGINLVS